MDISTLDTKKGAEKGAFMQLLHPVFGHPLFDETGDEPKPIGLFVRGNESPSVQKKLKALQKAPMTGAEQNGLEYVCALVVGVQGLERGGRPLEATRADLEYFFGLSDNFVEQVVTFARDRSNFFGQAESV